MKILTILLLSHPPEDFTSGLGSCLVLSTSPPAFQRFINQCLSGLRDSICIPYLEHILCYGKTFDQHLENLRTVFGRLRQVEVKSKSKIVFCLNQKKNILEKLSAKKGVRTIQSTQKLSKNYVNPLKL